MDSPMEARDWHGSQEVPVRHAQVARHDVRPWLAMRVEQWRRVAHLASMAMQGLTLAGVVYGLVAWRGVPPVAVAVFFAGIVAAAFLFAWFWYDVLGMREAEQQARFHLDKRDQDMLSPKEARLLGLAVRALRRDSEALQALEDAAKRGRL